MKISDAIKLFKSGAILKKTEHMIFKRNKIVRGTNYEYELDDTKITEKQFDELKSIPCERINKDKFREASYIYKP